MADWQQISNLVFDRERVSWLRYDPENFQKVHLHFDDGSDMYFEGGEAVEVWKLFSTEGDFRSE